MRQRPHFNRRETVMRQTQPVKIGILGEIRAGKDTVAQLIAHELEKVGNTKPTQFLAFADGIHKVIELTMPEVYVKGKPRKELQHIGQSLRQLKPDVWIDMLFNSIRYRIADDYGMNIIITDVRQPNEAQRLQEKGFKIIKVTASEEVRMQRAKDNGDNFSPEDFKHETELVIHQCPYDYLIDNSFCIDVLEERVLEILQEVVER
jgi:hypothetical protein